MSFTTFYSDPGTHAPHARQCHVCGAVCSVRRNVLVSRSYAEAMAGRKRPSDVHDCPWREAPWHQRAADLCAEAARLRSPRLRDLVIADLLDALGQAPDDLPLDPAHVSAHWRARE